MTNLRYAIAIIGALSLLLGLSLGQIYRQHQRIEQLEFNRLRQPAINFTIHPEHGGCFHHDRDWFSEQEQLQEKLDRIMQRFNKETYRWEAVDQARWERGLYAD